MMHTGRALTGNVFGGSVEVDEKPAGAFLKRGSVSVPTVILTTMHT